jgi:hypothetical protein
VRVAAVRRAGTSAAFNIAYCLDAFAVRDLGDVDPEQSSAALDRVGVRLWDAAGAFVGQRPGYDGDDGVRDLGAIRTARLLQTVVDEVFHLRETPVERAERQPEGP